MIMFMEKGLVLDIIFKVDDFFYNLLMTLLRQHPLAWLNLSLKFIYLLWKVYSIHCIMYKNINVLTMNPMAFYPIKLY